MSCHEIDRDELVASYVMGQLDPSRQDEFEIHVLECTKCLQALEMVQSVHDDLVQRAHQIRAQPVRRPLFRWKSVAHGAPVPERYAEIQSLKVFHGERNDLTQYAPEIRAKPVGPVGYRGYAWRWATAGALAMVVGGFGIVAFYKRAHPPGPVPALISSLEDFESRGSNSSFIEIPQLRGKSVTTDHARLTDVLEKEIFRLGTVQAPPYTFAGFAASKKGSQAGRESALSNGKPGQVRSSDPLRPYFQSAMDAYVEKRYGDAIDLLENAVKTEPYAADANFFLGICKLLQVKPEDSIAPLRIAAVNDKSPFSQPAHFYLAKAYLQTLDLEQAEVELAVASAMPGSYRTAARSILDRLQALHAIEKTQTPE